jgi:hypothetical protein
MPVRQRLNKRRLGVAAEAEAWAELFECGDDFFDDLEPFGFQSTGIGGDSGRAARAAAPKFWQRLGAYYLEHIWPRQAPHSVHQKPWALTRFGIPRGYRAKD